MIDGILRSNILIIESNNIVSFSIKKTLADLFPDITIKRTLYDSMDFIKANRIRCIIATKEILMENGQFYNIHNHLIKKGIPIIFMTIEGMEDTPYDLNIIDVIQKPFDPQYLSNRLKEFHLSN